MTSRTLAPLAAEGTFPGLPAALAQTRSWALACLPAGCGRADDVALVVSELATNALLHSRSGAPGGTFVLRLAVTADAVEVTVLDQGPAAVPAQRPAGEGGHGLALVAELADAYEARTTSAGRCAWCRIDL